MELKNSLSIINRQAIIVYMKTHVQPYAKMLRKWGAAKLNAVLTFSIGKDDVIYAPEIKKHLANMDIRTVIDQFKQRHIPPKHKYLICAPYVRKAQADVLLENGIDYCDLAGNIHLEAKGILVHVEGKSPLKKPDVFKGRMMQLSGLKVIFVLLVNKDAVRWTYRQIAKAVNINHGSVGFVLKDLASNGYISGKGERAVMTKKKELVAEWVLGYKNILRPKILLGRYKPQDPNIDDLVQRLESYYRQRRKDFILTGSQAAFRLNRFFKDTQLAFFTDQTDTGDLPKALRLFPDPNGQVTVLSLFCPIVAVQSKDYGTTAMIAHPLMIYAELMNDGTERALETAHDIYDKYLRELENEEQYRA